MWRLFKCKSHITNFSTLSLVCSWERMFTVKALKQNYRDWVSTLVRILGIILKAGAWWVSQLILQSPCWEDALLMQMEAQLPNLHLSFIVIWFGPARANEVSDPSLDFQKCKLRKHASMVPLYHPQLWVARLSTAHLLAAYYAQQKFSNVTLKTYQLLNQFVKFQNPPNFKSDWWIRSLYLNLMKA